MFKYTILILLFMSSAQACVCVANIKQAFTSMEDDVITNNLTPIDNTLKSYANQIQKNTDELKKQTTEYKALVQNEAALAVILEKKLFEIKKMNDLQSNVNNTRALEVETIFKQQENEAVYVQKVLSKERY